LRCDAANALTRRFFLGRGNLSLNEKLTGGAMGQQRATLAFWIPRFADLPPVKNQQM
jgi:hypothetical protein